MSLPPGHSTRIAARLYLRALRLFPARFLLRRARLSAAVPARTSSWPPRVAVGLSAAVPGGKGMRRSGRDARLYGRSRSPRPWPCSPPPGLRYLAGTRPGCRRRCLAWAKSASARRLSAMALGRPARPSQAMLARPVATKPAMRRTSSGKGIISLASGKISPRPTIASLNRSITSAARAKSLAASAWPIASLSVPLPSCHSMALRCNSETASRFSRCSRSRRKPEKR